MSGIISGVNGVGTPVIGTTGTFSGNATVGGTLAVTGALTATGGVVGTLTGNVQDNAYTDFRLPPYQEFLARTGLTSAAYYNPGRYTTGSIKSVASGADPIFAAANTPTYDYAVSGYRGLYIDADGDCVKIADFEPGVASMLMVEAFCVLADPGAARSLSGKSTTAAERLWYSQLTASDLVSVYIEDGTGHGDVDAGGVDQGPISYGASHIYLFSKFLDRRAAAFPSGNALRTRLSKYGTGLIGTEFSQTIAAVTTLSGGTAPTMNIGSMPGIQNGAGVVNLGWIIATGAQIEVNGLLATVAAACGAE